MGEAVKAFAKPTEDCTKVQSSTHEILSLFLVKITIFAVYSELPDAIVHMSLVLFVLFLF